MASRKFFRLYTSVANILLFLGGCTVLIFWHILSEQFNTTWDGEILFQLTGQVGDFIGGVVGLVIFVGCTLHLCPTLKGQTDLDQQLIFASAIRDLGETWRHKEGSQNSLLHYSIIKNLPRNTFIGIEIENIVGDLIQPFNSNEFTAIETKS